MTSSRPIRILVIDDTVPIRDLWCDVLTSAGYEVAATSDPREGLALFEGAPHVLVITDLFMPGVDGWGVVEAVRRRAPATPVIVVSGSAMVRDLAHARREGIPMLEKPLDLARLRGAVREMVGTGTTEPRARPGAG